MTDQIVAGAEPTPSTPATPAAEPVVNNTPAPAPASEPVQAQPAAVVNSWPDNWRELLAKDDAKELARLQRIADPSGLWGNYRNLENKLNSTRPALSDNPTAEELAAYRQANGIPESPDAYEFDLDGLTIGEEDYPVIDYMADVFHTENVPTKVANQIVQGYYKAQEQIAADRAEAEKAFKFENENTLRQEWGGNYTANLSAVKNLLAGMGEAGDILASARGSDGRLLFNDARVLGALANLSYEVNPAGTVVPGASGSQVTAINDEIAQIESFMKTNYHEYHKDANKKQRLLQLYDARGKLAARS